jgi:hypothetical protein
MARYGPCVSVIASVAIVVIWAVMLARDVVSADHGFSRRSRPRDGAGRRSAFVVHVVLLTAVAAVALLVVNVVSA